MGTDFHDNPSGLLTAPARAGNAYIVACFSDPEFVNESDLATLTATASLECALPCGCVHCLNFTNFEKLLIGQVKNFIHQWIYDFGWNILGFDTLGALLYEG
jgi:hypothetical protein